MEKALSYITNSPTPCNRKNMKSDVKRPSQGLWSIIKRLEQVMSSLWDSISSFQDRTF